MMFGRPVEYPGAFETSLMREARRNAQRNAKARVAMAARKAQAAAEAGNQAQLDALEEERRARQDLEDHAHALAEEIERARYRSAPNPWLGPFDPGYVSPTEFEVRRRLEAERENAASLAAAADRTRRLKSVLRQRHVRG